MNTFTVPNFEPKNDFEYSTGPIGLKALLVCPSVRRRRRTRPPLCTHILVDRARSRRARDLRRYPEGLYPADLQAAWLLTVIGPKRAFCSCCGAANLGVANKDVTQTHRQAARATV